MVFDFFPSGALTSKPYAFVARPWELEHTFSTDVFDSFGSAVQLHVRNSKILRIMPVINENLNEEWISDRIRFSFDGHQTQRLLMPFFRRESFLIPCDWDFAFDRFCETFFETDFFQVIVGRTVEREIYASLFLFSSNMGCSYTSGNNDIQKMFFLPQFLESLVSFDFGLLVGVNLKVENPLLHLYLAREQKNRLDLGLIGSKFSQDESIKNFGNNLSDFYNFLIGKNSAAIKFRMSKNPFVLINRSLLRYIPNNILILLEKYNNIFVIESSLSKLNQLDVGFACELSDFRRRPRRPFIYAIHSDSFSLPNKNCFFVYQGSNGFRSAAAASVIFPGVTFAEKKTSYKNMFGHLCKSFFAITPPSLARTDWRILSALGELFALQLPIMPFEFLVRNVSYWHSDGSNGPESSLVSLKFLNHRERNFFFLQKSIILLHSFDYFRVDAVSHSSKILALAARRFDSLKSNFY